ncbi:MAG: hypothetical protein ACOZQL_32770 [Myxococcota bacterium]
MIRVLFASASLLVGCGASTVIDGKQYKTACAAPTDCAAVFFGDQCGVCACPNAAISASDKVLYEADRTAARTQCGPQPAIACGPCQESVLTCTNGACGLQAK